jgi:hypothetical protein
MRRVQSTLENFSTVGVARFRTSTFTIGSDGEVSIKNSVTGDIDSATFGGQTPAFYLDINNSTGSIPIERGGTGLAALPSEGSILIGTGSAYSLTGSPTISGTVTSGFAVPANKDIVFTSGTWSGEKASKIQYFNNSLYLQYTTSLIARNSAGTNRMTLESNGDVAFGGSVTSTQAVLSNAGTATNNAVRADRSVSAGDGLSGGGNLTADRTLTVDSTVIRTTGNQSMSDIKTFTGLIEASGNTGAVNVNTAGDRKLEVRCDGTSNSAGNAAYMTFHRPNAFAVRFGLDTDNVMKVGGWSLGNVSYRVLLGDQFNNNTNDFVLRGTAPTITLRDTDHNTAYLHTNDNIFYILRGANDAAPGAWAQVNSAWPLTINLTNNNAQFGGDVLIASDGKSFRQNTTSTWGGNPANGQGKIEYHSNRWYFTSGADSTEVARFRRSATDVFVINNSGQVTVGDVPWARLSSHITLTAGDGLTGGGVLDQNRSFAVDSTVMRNNVRQTITKDNHASGASDYHLELFAPQGAGAGEVSLRFHQGSTWWGQIRARSDGFHFTQGDTNTYRNIFFATATGNLTGTASNASALSNLVIHTGTNNEANKIVRTDANGYINAGWINTISGNNGTTALDRIYASNDQFIRYYTPANFASVMNSWLVRTSGDQTITDTKTFSGTISFGSATRQMLNLWSTAYALGVQSSTLYYRSGSRFSWFRGGSHSDTENDSGGGTVAMTLDGSSNLSVTGSITTGGNLTVPSTQSSNFWIRNTSPTIYLRDTDHNVSMIHCNSNIFYILRGDTDATTWTQVNSRWPLEINLTNNNAQFGGDVLINSDARAFRQNTTANWSGNTGNGQGKMEYHSNRWYFVSGADSTEVARFRRSATDIFVIDNSGNVTASGTVTANSDIRLKDNIELIENPIEKLEKIRGVSFTRKDQDDKEQRHIGVIAQEVEEVLPELIRECDGIKSVAYGNLTAVLIEAIKELKNEVDELKKIINK